MSLDADWLIDRAALKRRLLVWRILAVLALVAAGTAVSYRHATGLRPHVARLAVTGIVTDDPATVRLVDRATHDPTVKALLLRIDSPGGSAAGGVALHDALARFSARKPLVAVMGAEAASAAYMIALPASRIYASPATLTGSIGVILETPDISSLMQRLGVTETQIVSGPLKGQPSPFAPLSPAGRTYLQDLVNDMFDQFVTMVATARHLPKARVLTLADGRAYTGRQALPLGLIDALGDAHDARAFLATRGVPLSLPETALAAPGQVRSWFGRGASLPGWLQPLMQLVFPQRAKLDGLVSLWQP